MPLPLRTAAPAWVSLAMSAATFLTTGSASAQIAPLDPTAATLSREVVGVQPIAQAGSEVMVSRLNRTLDIYVRHARASRWISGTGLVAGGALLAVSALAIDPAARFGTALRAVYIGTGTAIAVTGALLWVLPSWYEQFARHESELSAQGVPASERLARVEQRWADAAARERRGRRLAGVLSLVCGALAGATTALVFAQDTVNFPIGVISGMTSLVAFGSGAMVLATPGTVEQSWRLWQAGREQSMRGVGWGSPGVTLAGGGGLLQWLVRF